MASRAKKAREHLAALRRSHAGQYIGAEDCRHHYASDNPHGRLAPLGFFIGAPYRWFGRFLEANGEVLVGAFTLALAVFTYKLWKNDWHTREDARRAIFRYIETWYNRKRRHYTFGYISPAE